MANIQQLPDKSQVQKIIQLHNEVELVAQTIMQKAVIIGELLTKVKASLPHGTFGFHLEHTFPFKIRTAQMYMKAFEKRDLIASGKITALHQLNEKNAEAAHLNPPNKKTDFVDKNVIKYTDFLKNVKGDFDLLHNKVSLLIRMRDELSNYTYDHKDYTQKVAFILSTEKLNNRLTDLIANVKQDIKNKNSTEKLLTDKN